MKLSKHIVIREAFKEILPANDTKLEELIIQQVDSSAELVAHFNFDLTEEEALLLANQIKTYLVNFISTLRYLRGSHESSNAPN